MNTSNSYHHELIVQKANAQANAVVDEVKLKEAKELLVSASMIIDSHNEAFNITPHINAPAVLRCWFCCWSDGGWRL
eukprot:6172335-Pleurochrysis_carterae.AAC.1